ncbi:GntR family transcriptional regulator [Leucobacter sp. CSA2]|uniref:GntR family transcriptional regulator n=1 Tax=Leucobacter edaphi TaxID=2796472 RepID=A0A934QCV4_9MICO|nr:GntR family transcriptional regulator [Leucobacter edaphi]MBK0420927.1 GntR family transcriptional regulator [Leucobacter edaphi]
MRASDRAYAALVEEIHTGSLAPGAVIAEVEQAERLGVSRTPMREAIGRLLADGLVRQHSPRVLVVSDFAASDIRHLFEVRRALEETAARIAAQRGDRAEFARLAEEFAASKPGTERETDSYYSLIARYDEAVGRAAGNAFLSQALRGVRTHLARARRIARDHPERLAASVAEHATIARAIAAGDSELAAHATHVHLSNALDSILATLGAAEPEGTR